MSGIVASGLGAVSSAGWGVPAMMAMLDAGGRPEVSRIERATASGETRSTPVARVPALPDRALLPKEPRLRRASSVGKYGAAAVYEALGRERFEAVKAGALRVGVVTLVMNGCVNYSNRFYGEVLSDPSVASPILFPETVYNAPSSHFSAMMRCDAPNDTLLGDAAEWFAGLELAAEWLVRGDCDACVVVALEEVDWLSAEAMGYYSRRLLPSEGAAAVLLEPGEAGARLLAVPDAVSYAEEPDRGAALRRVWTDLGAEDDGRTLWSDGRTGVPGFDRAENEVGSGWAGPRLSVRTVLGESLGAAAGLQTVAALARLSEGAADRAVITAVGGNEGVGGALFGV